MSPSCLPSPPLDDNKSIASRKISKPGRSLNRSSKRSSSSLEPSSGILDGRHKRVWKACERCRMKKTKCDGESPCKRCKDDGLVCTAGSRKKTEFKQLPRGYAEVLENTQYALIATVQKLYTMLRNGEQWDLGEPELNDRAQPVIHDIASKLGCIRASPDLPYAFPEGEQDFAELQAQLQSARTALAAEENASRKPSEDLSSYSPGLPRTERASSSDSDHSNVSREYNQAMWGPRPAAATLAPRKPAPLNTAPRPSASASAAAFDEETYKPSRPPALDAGYSMPSPVYTDLKTETPMFHHSSPFSPWSGGDDFLVAAHPLEVTSSYLKQMPPPPPLARQPGFDADSLKAMQMNPAAMGFANDGTIRPGMLDCHPAGFDDPMDAMFATEYKGQMGMA
ncbi:uncharacterized protein L3040_006206 [Drepanopeziza brunnea f. sp. 'multigermtubi']|uniref:C6 zinc finger domain containing protein n=1 Tax=Marssonina brunnea f. sp. multigermtubi (strain MB_m1) TaxID=1072389 RepID=K1WRU5_MARBU|nr:c6 zinc finger domain containing protein [Drepanopeziza brunnea f. sp. 'multigermtubi' MB_m1]EKD20375.1 c6 zinc finger domain containing protein [Drepanopeziza brunnea f. sp. 'multigermtubi' MB_m1]KAJ5040553.1 hypothetical protein L3040_006206 [Drepanopeziza brunnea f. sp. 'multigermtubi']